MGKKQPKALQIQNAIICQITHCFTALVASSCAPATPLRVRGKVINTREPFPLRSVPLHASLLQRRSKHVFGLVRGAVGPVPAR